MPEVPDNVPIYISSEHGEGEDSDVSRQALMEDKCNESWQPYLPEEKKPAPNKKDSQTAGPEAVKSPPGQVSYLSSKNVSILLAITAINLFIFGVFVGSRILPKEPLSSSLEPTLANFFGEHKRAPANIVADIVSMANPCVVTLDVRVIPRKVADVEHAYQQINTPNELIPSQASGLIVRSDGYIVTSAHALKKYDSLEVLLYGSNKIYPARLIGKDEFTDLAVIKIDADNLPVLKFGDLKDLRAGDWVIAIGSPLGFDHTVTTGIVSATDRSLADVNNNRVELIQHDALLYVGNSGGPLLNIKGEVVGLNAAVRSQTPGLGFSIPADTVSDVASALIKDGKIKRPFMGMVMEDIDPNMTRSLTLPSQAVAVKVTRVVAKGPAETAKIQGGDIILKVNGVSVVSSREVRVLTRNNKPGDIIELLLLREGKQIPVKFRFGDYHQFNP